MSSDPVAFTFAGGGEPLTASSLAELAELGDCALDAGDQVERLRAVGRDGPRPLTRFELGRLVGLLADDG